MAIDPTQQALRQALLGEFMRRAITTRERAELKRREQANPESQTQTAAADEGKARPDAGNGGSAPA